MAYSPTVHFEPKFARVPDVGPYVWRLSRRLGFRPWFPLRVWLEEALGAYVAFARRREPDHQEQLRGVTRRLPSVEDRRKRCELLERTVRAVLSGRRDRIPSLERLLETSGGLALTRRSPLTPHIGRTAPFELWDAVDNVVLNPVAPRQGDGVPPPSPALPTSVNAAALANLRACQAGLVPWSSLTHPPPPLAATEPPGRSEAQLLASREGRWSRDWSEAVLLMLLESIHAEQRQLARPHKQDKGTPELRILLEDLRTIWREGTGTEPVAKVYGPGVPSPSSVPFFAFVRWVLHRAEPLRSDRDPDWEDDCWDPTADSRSPRGYHRRMGTTSPAALHQQFLRLDRRSSLSEPR